MNVTLLDGWIYGFRDSQLALATSNSYIGHLNIISMFLKCFLFIKLSSRPCPRRRCRRSGRGPLTTHHQTRRSWRAPVTTRRPKRALAAQARRKKLQTLRPRRRRQKVQQGRRDQVTGQQDQVTKQQATTGGWCPDHDQQPAGSTTGGAKASVLSGNDVSLKKSITNVLKNVFTKAKQNVEYEKKKKS